MLAAFARLPQRYALALALLLVAIAGGGSVALVGAGWWITPVGFVPAALLAYPLWSWRRLELNAAALDREIALLDADALAVAAPSQANRSPHLDRRWLAFNEATERLRRARRFLAASLDGLPEAVLLADAQGSVMLANRRAAALFEVEDAGELTGLSLPRLLEEMGSASGIDWPSELRAVAEQRAALSVPVQLAGHGDFLVSVAPAPDADGPRLIVACADISSIKAAQRQREEALAFVTHDLRSPLSSIALLADLHRRGIQPLGPDAMMLEVQRLANRALTLSEDFVRLAQAESKPLEMASGDLCALVLEARRDVAPQALASAITLDFVPPAGGMAIGFFDRELLQRAVGNLLTNAIKFSPPNSKVTVSVTLREGAFLIRVQDQGPGLNAQQLSKLFGAYVRVGADPAQAGVGLGLQFVQRVADRHGGWVRAESTPGQGARFDLLVPAG